MGKKKNKKVKSVLGVPINFDHGQRVKTIKIDKNKYKKFNLVTLIILNLFLALTMVHFISVAYNIYILFIAIFTMFICFVWSILSYNKSILNIKYIINENSVVKDFDTSINVGILAKLSGYKIKQSFIDRIGKNKTHTIILRFKNTWCSKISFSCINENPDRIIKLITNLATTAKENEPKNAKKNNKKIEKEQSIIESKLAQATTESHLIEKIIIKKDKNKNRK